MDYVRRNTSARKLIDPKKLVYDLALINDGTPHCAMCDAIVQQYQLAKDFGDLR